MLGEEAISHTAQSGVKIRLPRGFWADMGGGIRADPKKVRHSVHGRTGYLLHRLC